MGKQKFIFVTGGVLSGVGKGITAASIGAVLQAKGVSVSVQKCDPKLPKDNPLIAEITYLKRRGATFHDFSRYATSSVDTISSVRWRYMWCMS